jgi:hypothetical protein
MPRVPTYLDEFNAQGQVVHTCNRPPDPVVTGTPAWAQEAAAYLSPLGPTVFAQLGSQSSADAEATPVFGVEQTIMSYVSFTGTAHELIVIFFLDLALAVVVFVCARRVHFSNGSALGWAALTLFFGLPGLLAFRCASDWPRLVRCPQCGVKRPAGDSKCSACQKPWPAPALTGVEIFDQEIDLPLPRH